MKQKNFGLVVAILVLFLMAVFSVRRVEVAPGIFSTEAELRLGAKVYRQNCRSCHGRSDSGALKRRIGGAGSGR